MMTIHQTIEMYHQSADDFSRGDPKPVKDLYSREDDVILANPFGPPVLGWKSASERLDFASSRFSDGKVEGFDRLAFYESDVLCVLFEIEHWKAKVSGRNEVSTFDLRVTSTFRNENGTWKIIHRHADPITSFHPDGPLRGN